MITTNLITFEISFVNSTETLIFNNSLKSLTELNDYLKPRNLYLKSAKIKEFDKSQSKFKRCSKERFLNCIDHFTELHLKFN